MLVRQYRLFFLIGILIGCAGCDLEGVVQRKVPDPIKQLLTFSAPGDRAKARGHGKLEQVTLEVASPVEESAYPAGKPITFRASALVDGQEMPAPDLTWGLVEGKGKPVKPIGRGLSFSRPFDPGSYRVDLTLVTPEKVKVAKSVNFRVFAGFPGKITHNGQGLADVDLALADLKSDSVIARARSAADGSFLIEVPPQGLFKLTPSKAEFSFSPPYHQVRHADQPTPAEFAGAKAQIQQIRLTAGEDSDEKLQSVCPEQQVHLKAVVASELPVTRLQIALVTVAEGDAKPVPIGEAILSPEAAGSGETAGQRTVKVAIPAGVTGKALKATFGLRLTAHDSNGNSFATEVPGCVSIDVGRCVALSFSEAVEAHERGELANAIRAYDKIEHTQRLLRGTSALGTYGEKSFFNRGLAYLQAALALPDDDVRRVGYMGKASADFKAALKLHRKDAPAFLFSGLVKQLNRQWDAAVEDYTSAVVADPGLAEALELKGRAYLETRLKKNLSRAVDEFTEALTINPDDKSLRTSRSALLKLDMKHQNDRDDAEVDISSVPLDEIDKRLNMAKFRRK